MEVGFRKRIIKQTNLRNECEVERMIVNLKSWQNFNHFIDIEQCSFFVYKIVILLKECLYTILLILIIPYFLRIK